MSVEREKEKMSDEARMKRKEQKKKIMKHKYRNNGSFWLCSKQVGNETTATIPDN